ncbi:MAG TPA: hypothetical protein DCS93_28135 [Microscillaceae bacterium]|nr:hypothetical protein [Microscillaceae bacterium]
MKVTTTLRTMTFALFCACITFALHATPNHSKSNAVKYYYVLAPSGLNLRQTASTSSKKIARLPYGAQVNYLAGVPSQMIMVDNIKGGMAKVSYQGKVGYVFEGYLSKFVAPKKYIEVKKYAQILRKSGLQVMTETGNKDYDGYQQFNNAIHIPTQSWTEAFIVAKQLFGIPAKLHFPDRGSAVKQKIDNPDKKSYAWTDQMVVNRTSNGQLKSIEYNYRAEGGGSYVVIMRSKNMNGFILAQNQVAD